MPHLTHPPFPQIIPLLPVGDHAVRVEADRWRDPLVESGLGDHFHAIFNGHNEVQLTRDMILGQANPTRKCIEILLWGYPAGMRNNYHLAYLGNIEQIEIHAQAIVNWPTYYGNFGAINGIGISTVTKIAYFFGRIFAGNQAVILDNRIISVINGGAWVELNGLHGIAYGNAVNNYINYLEVVSGVAAEIGATSAQVELFLFSLGVAFI